MDEDNITPEEQGEVLDDGNQKDAGMEAQHKMPTQTDEESVGEGSTLSLGGMFREYWIDYASDVILDRSVPDIDDGLKPVQRRILHAMKETDDGRYTKVANIVGTTMLYHPHGDASINDALVNMG